MEQPQEQVPEVPEQVAQEINIKLNTKKLQEILGFLVLGTETSALKSEKSKCFFFKTVEKQLYVYVASQNIQLSSSYGEIPEPLNICLDALKIKHLVDKTTKEDITFSCKEGCWKIKGSGVYTLKNFSFDTPGDFFNQELKTELLGIHSTEFAKAMERSIFFVNEERQDHHLRNFYFDGNMVATDKKSIQVVKTSLTGKTEVKILIPQIFYDVCNKLNSEVKIYDQEGSYIITSGNKRAWLPKIAGVDKFPDYEAFIQQPEAYENSLTVDRVEFLKALARATYFTSKDQFFRVKLSVEKEKIRLIVDEDDKIEEEVPCNSTGELEFALNGKYLKEAFEIFSEEKVLMKYNDFKDVVYLKEENSRLILVPVLMQ